jgi:hypothetical protein
MKLIYCIAALLLIAEYGALDRISALNQTMDAAKMRDFFKKNAESH